MKTLTGALLALVLLFGVSCVEETKSSRSRTAVERFDDWQASREFDLAKCADHLETIVDLSAKGESLTTEFAYNPTQANYRALERMMGRFTSAMGNVRSECPSNQIRDLEEQYKVVVRAWYEVKAEFKSVSSSSSDLDRQKRLMQEERYRRTSTGR